MTLDHLTNTITHAIINSVIHGAIFKVFREISIGGALFLAATVIAIIWFLVKFKKS